MVAAARPAASSIHGACCLSKRSSHFEISDSKRCQRGPGVIGRNPFTHPELVWHAEGSGFLRNQISREESGPVRGGAGFFLLGWGGKAQKRGGLGHRPHSYRMSHGSRP